MKLRELFAEADPNTLGKMNNKMRDVLSKVDQDDQAQAKADAEAKVKAKADQRAEAARLRKEDPEMLQQYIDMLKSHDWTYDYSDDHNAWTKGHEERNAIRSMAKTIDPDLEIYNKYDPLKKENMGESATEGTTVSANVTVGPVAAHTGGKSYTGDPWGGKSGTKAPKVPKATQKKNKNGTAVNALDMKGANLLGGQGLVKR